ncbi:MAG: cobalamin-binding protein [Gammaproteobacteria bacterium]|nr:cobalamin-binding protein [Gammaproteobacteria bacterium]
MDTSNHPASRIITLAPHLTELVYSAGAGSRLVGTVEYSDYPAAALDLPRIGDAFRLDHEAIIGLKPDLILAWGSGTPRGVIDRLEQLNHRVVALKAGSLDGVADNIRTIGQLAGTEQDAEAAALAFEVSLDEIRVAAAGREPVTVFYQVSSQPLFTISRRHIIGEAIELCGGHNVFGKLLELSPSISPEAVIDAAPEVIIATQYSDDASVENSFAVWRQWVSIPAVHDGNLFLIDANLMTRPSVRILGGVLELCARIAMAREKRASTAARPAPHAGLVYVQ